MSIPFSSSSPLQENPPSVEETLDLLHTAASNADLETYFSLFSASNGTFLGTDLQERWTIPEFYLYAKPYFDQGQGWTYTPISRNITYHNSYIAWFDEILQNDRFGSARSTGVVVREDDAHPWKIAQFHLTVPIPNHLMDTVVGIIKFDGSHSI